jgi:hypothetical protein
MKAVADDTVWCMALDRAIDWGYCMDLEMATDNMIIWEGLEDRFSDNQMLKCRQCMNRVNPVFVEDKA